MHAYHSVQLLSRVWLLATPWTAALQASLSLWYISLEVCEFMRRLKPPRSFLTVQLLWDAGQVAFVPSSLKMDIIVYTISISKVHHEAVEDQKS